MMRSTEKLETSLTIAVAVFYFLPMITLILAPLMIELIGSL
jgi:hypothetical protein